MYGEDALKKIQNTIKQDIKQIIPVTGGFVNDVFKIKIENEWYILKIYKLIDTAKLYRSIKVQTLAAKQGYSPSIKLYHNEIGYFAVEEYIAGRKAIIGDLRDAFLLGENLGKMHLCLASIPINEEMGSLKFDNTGRGRILSKEPVLSQLLSLKEQILDQTPVLGKKEIQLIHGDYHVGNVIISGETIKTIDFDETKYTVKGYDIIKILITAMENNKGFDNSIRAFIKGYLTNNEIQTKELTNSFFVYSRMLAYDKADFLKSISRDLPFTQYRIRRHQTIVDLLQRLEKNADFFERFLRV